MRKYGSSGAGNACILRGDGKQLCLDKCMEKAKEMMKWDEKFPSRDMGNGKVRGVGVAMAMQAQVFPL